VAAIFGIPSPAPSDRQLVVMLFCKRFIILFFGFLLLAPDGLSQDVRRLPPPTEFVVGEEVGANEGISSGETVESIDATLGLDGPELGGEMPSLSPDEPVASWYSPTYWFGPTPWDTGFELGLNGSSGTSNTLSTRVGGYLKRKSEKTKLNASLYQNRTKADGDETQNNALLDVRYDWLMNQSPWSLFVMNQTFYDAFQAYDLNVNVNTGFGYELVNTEFLKFSTTLGSGVARKFGGRRDEWTPEAQGGVKWEQQVCESQKFYAKVDYFPEWQDFNNYRILTDIGWEVELSRPSNVSLKMSLSDRFDSKPDGFNPHNTNYSVLLLWKK
jgi:putative salt-induced outer membrane protein YdiY